MGGGGIERGKEKPPVQQDFSTGGGLVILEDLGANI